MKMIPFHFNQLLPKLLEWIFLFVLFLREFPTIQLFSQSHFCQLASSERNAINDMEEIKRHFCCEIHMLQISTYETLAVNRLPIFR